MKVIFSDSFKRDIIIPGQSIRFVDFQFGRYYREVAGPEIFEDSYRAGDNILSDPALVAGIVEPVNNLQLALHTPAACVTPLCNHEFSMVYVFYRTTSGSGKKIAFILVENASKVGTLLKIQELRHFSITRNLISIELPTNSRATYSFPETQDIHVLERSAGQKGTGVWEYTRTSATRLVLSDAWKDNTRWISGKHQEGKDSDIPLLNYYGEKITGRNIVKKVVSIELLTPSSSIGEESIPVDRSISWRGGVLTLTANVKYKTQAIDNTGVLRESDAVYNGELTALGGYGLVLEGTDLAITDLTFGKVQVHSLPTEDKKECILKLKYINSDGTEVISTGLKIVQGEKVSSWEIDKSLFKEDGKNLYILGYESGSTIEFGITTTLSDPNEPTQPEINEISGNIGVDYFNVAAEKTSGRINIKVTTKRDNERDTWVPLLNDVPTPSKWEIKFLGKRTEFWLVQAKKLPGCNIVQVKPTSGNNYGIVTSNELVLPGYNGPEPTETTPTPTYRIGFGSNSVLDNGTMDYWRVISCPENIVIVDSAGNKLYKETPGENTKDWFDINFNPKVPEWKNTIRTDVFGYVPISYGYLTVARLTERQHNGLDPLNWSNWRIVIDIPMTNIPISQTPRQIPPPEIKIMHSGTINTYPYMLQVRVNSKSPFTATLETHGDSMRLWEPNDGDVSYPLGDYTATGATKEVLSGGIFKFKKDYPEQTTKPVYVNILVANITPKRKNGEPLKKQYLRIKQEGRDEEYEVLLPEVMRNQSDPVLWGYPIDSVGPQGEPSIFLDKNGTTKSVTWKARGGSVIKFYDLKNNPQHIQYETITDPLDPLFGSNVPVIVGPSGWGAADQSEGEDLSSVWGFNYSRKLIIGERVTGSGIYNDVFDRLDMKSTSVDDILPIKYIRDIVVENPTRVPGSDYGLGTPTFTVYYAPTRNDGIKLVNGSDNLLYNISELPPSGYGSVIKSLLFNTYLPRYFNYTYSNPSDDNISLGDGLMYFTPSTSIEILLHQKKVNINYKRKLAGYDDKIVQVLKFTVQTDFSKVTMADCIDFSRNLGPNYKEQLIKPLRETIKVYQRGNLVGFLISQDKELFNDIPPHGLTLPLKVEGVEDIGGNYDVVASSLVGINSISLNKNTNVVNVNFGNANTTTMLPMYDLGEDPNNASLTSPFIRGNLNTTSSMNVSGMLSGHSISIIPNSFSWGRYGYSKQMVYATLANWNKSILGPTVSTPEIFENVTSDTTELNISLGLYWELRDNEGSSTDGVYNPNYNNHLRCRLSEHTINVVPLSPGTSAVIDNKGPNITTPATRFFWSKSRDADRAKNLKITFPSNTDSFGTKQYRFRIDYWCKTEGSKGISGVGEWTTSAFIIVNQDGRAMTFNSIDLPGHEHNVVFNTFGYRPGNNTELGKFETNCPIDRLFLSNSNFTITEIGVGSAPDLKKYKITALLPANLTNQGYQERIVLRYTDSSGQQVDLWACNIKQGYMKLVLTDINTSEPIGGAGIGGASTRPILLPARNKGTGADRKVYWITINHYEWNTAGTILENVPSTTIDELSCNIVPETVQGAQSVDDVFESSGPFRGTILISDTEFSEISSSRPALEHTYITRPVYYNTEVLIKSTETFRIRTGNDTTLHNIVLYLKKQAE